MTVPGGCWGEVRNLILAIDFFLFMWQIFQKLELAPEIERKHLMRETLISGRTNLTNAILSGVS